ncbi:hypothetical protein HD598_000639 [Neomicrococcus aestuarii]|uniref:Uncharacterized protein n=1 Tax=Neomicrococcus aestuarii TaxID=556325 RepID=A0A7W8TS61_9MICC|nr:hypothetical protein [Neomicrococcus aestuarii]
MVKCFNESRAGGGATGDCIFEDSAAAGSLKGIPLELGVLPIGRNTGVTDEIEMLSCH